MFTEGTRQFGIWKIGHPSTSRYSGRPTQAILLAYGFCAFLTWFIFIVTLKIRGEFFLIEGMNLPLHRVAQRSDARSEFGPSSLTLAVRPLAEGENIGVVFDSGHAFIFPRDADDLNNHLESRVREIELSALLRKKISPGIGTVDLWVDERIALASVRPLEKILVRNGFDTLRYAVEGPRASSSGARP